MTTPTNCPQCNTANAGHTNADSCPACGFKFVDRGPTKIAKGNSAVATTGYIIAAAAGAVILIGFISQLLA